MSTRPLSSYNVCYQIQQDICDIMNKSPVILSAGIEFIAEDSQSVDYQIKENLKKQGIAAIVMTPSLDYLGHNGDSEAYQLNDLTIEFVEYTPINRASNSDVVCTGIDLANYASELLGGPNAVIGFGKMKTNGIEQGEDGGLLVTKLTFRTYIENGDAGPIIYIPFVTKEEMEEYVGNGKLTFTKDGHTIGEFTANQKTDISVEIPSGGSGSGVSKIIAGNNITISPADGTGEVTISASGGGSGEIPADLSCNHLSVGTSVSLGLGCTASGEYGSIAQGAYSTATANAAVALGSQCSATKQMSYAIGYKAEARHMNSMVLALADHNFPTVQSNGYNSLNIYVGNGQPSNDALNSILVNGWTLKSHIDDIIESKPTQQQLYFYPYNIDNTTQYGQNIYIGTNYSNFDTGIICFDVQYSGGHPFYVSYTDPITYNTNTLEYYLSPNTFNGGYVGAIITVPCVFGQGVNIYNDQGSQMTVRELFRIECQPSS